MLANALRATAKPDLWADADFMKIYRRVYPFTMTSPVNVHTLYNSVRHLVAQDVPGDFVECGVWRGGSSMTMALALLQVGAAQRELFLYDTYSGMEPPSREDGELVIPWSTDGFVVDAEAVRANLESTGYPAEKTVLVEGRVEDTLPETAPETIALLRLDTDFYSSTRCELDHLFPRLAPGGILIIDDYGAFRGSRRAVDEYFAEHGIDMYLNRVDISARLGVKRA